MNSATDLKNFFLETERLLLVPINHKYKEDIFREFTPEVAVFLFPQPSSDIQHTIEFIESSLQNIIKSEDLQLVALDKNTKEFLGCVGLHKLQDKVPELGLWFKRSTWGRGYGRESMMALKEWAKDNLICSQLKYPVAKDNLPSRKIAEILGGEIIREFVGKNMNGREMEEVEYRIKLK